MPDNIKVQAGIGDDSTAPPVATDLVGGAHFQRIKVGYGVDGVYNDATDADGFRLPVGGAQLGPVNEAAPSTDTGVAGLNGRLQRVAQRITALMALLPASLGQKTLGASLAVVLASDQTPVPAAQSGAWTVQPGNTANTTAWRVDGSAVVQPISGSVTANAGTNTSTAALAAASSVDAGDEATTDESIAGPSAGLRLIGFSSRETIGSGGAVFNLRHGTSNAGALLVTVSLGPGESAREWYGPDGLAAASGIWLERVSGQCVVVGYSKVVA